MSLAYEESAIKVDKDIPMPKPNWRGRPAFYPWKDMEVGDSFLHPGKNIQAARTAASQASRRSGKTFRARQTEEGNRIWRVA